MLFTLTRALSSQPVLYSVQCMQSLHTMNLHACAVRPLSHRTSVKKQRIVSHEECTRFHAKNYASVRFCRRSGPTFVRQNFSMFAKILQGMYVHVAHVKHYCPFTRSSFCNISQTLRTFCKECFFFPSCKKGLIKCLCFVTIDKSPRIIE